MEPCPQKASQKHVKTKLNIYRNLPRYISCMQSCWTDTAHCSCLHLALSKEKIARPSFSVTRLND